MTDSTIIMLQDDPDMVTSRRVGEPMDAIGRDTGYICRREP
ncbi:MAG: hypothetical protein WBL67_21900 [Nitrososphaeraceae archaeon]